MKVRNITVSCFTVALGAAALTLQANPDGSDHRRMSNQPTNAYWQTPNWSGLNRPPTYYAPPPAPAQQVYSNTNQTPPVYRSPQRPNYNPAPYANNNMPPSAPNSYRGYPPPPQGPYRGPRYAPDNGVSAFNTPGYNQYRNNGGRNNRWNNNNWDNNKFWGRSGPSTWMNPNKNNMERGWDDMINAPSRMGTMPGGWNAPEVSMPNPIDVGDQMQDNVKDLPEQIRNMDVGNN